MHRGRVEHGRVAAADEEQRALVGGVLGPQGWLETGREREAASAAGRTPPARCRQASARQAIVAGLRSIRWRGAFLAIIGTIVPMLTSCQKSPFGWEAGKVL
jgi:hypothetical protein